MKAVSPIVTEAATIVDCNGSRDNGTRSGELERWFNGCDEGRYNSTNDAELGWDDGTRS